MSRSLKKSPCYPIACGKSNKISKQICNRRFRRRERRSIFLSSDMPYKTREITDVWDFLTDRLSFWHTNMDKRFYHK